MIEVNLEDPDKAVEQIRSLIPDLTSAEVETAINEMERAQTAVRRVLYTLKAERFRRATGEGSIW